MLVSEITATSVPASTVTALAGGPTVYTVTVTPPPLTVGVVTLNLAAGMAQDTCGNNNTAAAPVPINFDTTNPTVVLSGAASGCAAGTVTATFSVPVNGVLAGDFVLANATAGVFTAVSTTVYTLTFTSTGAAVTADMAAGAANAIAGGAPSSASDRKSVV